MMDADDLVETSDNDEREILLGGEQSYWYRAANDIRARRPVVASSSTRPYRSQEVLDSQNPRKRVKVRPKLLL